MTGFLVQRGMEAASGSQSPVPRAEACPSVADQGEVPSPPLTMIKSRVRWSFDFLCAAADDPPVRKTLCQEHETGNVKGDDLLNRDMLSGDLLETHSEMITRVEVQAYEGGLGDELVTFVNNDITQLELARATEAFEHQSKEVLSQLGDIVPDAALMHDIWDDGDAPGEHRQGGHSAGALGPEVGGDNALVDETAHSDGLPSAHTVPAKPAGTVSADTPEEVVQDPGGARLAELCEAVAGRELATDAVEENRAKPLTGDNHVVFGRIYATRNEGDMAARSWHGPVALVSSTGWVGGEGGFRSDQTLPLTPSLVLRCRCRGPRALLLCLSAATRRPRCLDASSPEKKEQGGKLRRMALT